MGDQKKHALCSPSGSSGWMQCRGWEGGGSSAFADEGSFAHSIAAGCLESDRDAIELLGYTEALNGVEYVFNEEQAECVQIYLDTVWSIPGELYIEQSLPVGLITGEMVEDEETEELKPATGTADAVIVQPHLLTICDLKMGRGVEVKAEGNKQLRIYALAAMQQYPGDYKDVSLWIIQPRLSKSPVEWTVSVADLLEFGKEVYEKAQLKLSYVKGDELNANVEGCRWCAKKGTCESFANQALALIADDFVDLTSEERMIGKLQNAVDNVKDYHHTRLANAKKGLELVRMWADAVEDAAFKHLTSGQPLKGFKLVRGKEGHRKFEDEVKVANILGLLVDEDQIYDRNVKTPPVLEKLFKNRPHIWSSLQKHITRPPGKLSVVGEDDPREAISAGISDDDFVVIMEDFV